VSLSRGCLEGEFCCCGEERLGEECGEERCRELTRRDVGVKMGLRLRRRLGRRRVDGSGCKLGDVGCLSGGWASLGDYLFVFFFLQLVKEGALVTYTSKQEGRHCSYIHERRRIETKNAQQVCD
jgi:hypothetical protein